MSTLRALLTEGMRDAAAAGLRSVAIAVFVAGCVGGGGAADLTSRAHTVTRIVELADAGAWVAVARSDSSFPSDRCRWLNGAPALVAAGAVGASRPARFASAPSATYTAYPVTPEVIRVLVSGPPPADPKPATVAVGSRVAGELGLRTGSAATLISVGTVSVVVLPDTPRSARYRGSVLVPQDRFAAAECLASFAIGTRDPVDRLERLLAVDVPIQASPVLTGGRFVDDPLGDDARRTTRHWPLVAAGLVAVLVGITTLARRRDLALYRSLGFGRSEVAIVVAAGTSVASVGGAAIGVLLAAGLAAPATAVTAADARGLLSGAAAVCAAALLGAITGALAPRGSLAESLKADP